MPTCPYCNALLTPGRSDCPRCGEAVAEGIVPASDLRGISKEPTAPAPYRKPVEANRRTALAILAVMLVMAVVGGAYALLTVQWRRDNDKGITRASRRPVLPPLGKEKETETTPPARLPALLFLPEGMDVVAGLHVADLLASPVGAKVKGEALRLAGKEFSLDDVEKWLGVPAGNIDHLVIGAALAEVRVPPPVVVVLRTKTPLGVNRLREALRAGPAKESGGRSVSQGGLAGLPVELWIPDPKTAVIGTTLEKVPVRKAEGLERIAPPIRSTLQERLAGGMGVWAVAHSEAWHQSPLLPLLPGTKSILGESKLEDVKTLAAWVPASSPLRLQAAVKASDPEAAKRLEAEAAKVAGTKAFVEKEWLTLQRALGG